MFLHLACVGVVAHPRTTTSTVKSPIGDYCSFGNSNTNLITVSLRTEKDIKLLKHPVQTPTASWLY